ncbi:hypothetical protein [Methyloligella solikamskensis]|uniref:Uncharacterized protein n=1 Tax=Methyloligella solikamskensis TaxID=1177756 RepID=A0ABW3JAZ8_9HYPH
MSRWVYKFLLNVILLAMFLAGCLAALILVIRYIEWPDDSTELHAKILKTEGKVSSFKALHPDAGWDAVCYFAPYQDMKYPKGDFVEENFADYTRTPSKRYVMEAEYVIGFVDQDLRKIELYPLAIVGREEGIYSIEGPQCLERAKASFVVEDLEWPDRRDIKPEHSKALRFLEDGGK